METEYGKYMPAKRLRLNTSRLIREALGITAIGRHSLKGPTKSGLTEEGKAKARWSGEHLPHGFKVFARAGEIPRHRSTARKAVNAYPGPKEMRIRVAAELGFKWIKDLNALEALIKKIGEPQFFADWFDGKISKTIVEDPVILGERILQGTIRETHQLMQSTPEKPFHLNVTSSGYEVGILKALGIDYRAIRPKKSRSKDVPKPGQTLRETEALLFFHLPDGKTILSYRGNKFDVTKKLEHILSKKE